MSGLGLLRMYDASVPPSQPYPGCQLVAGYIGGNTPHVWTAAEWNAASSNGQLPMLPIWVGFGEDSPAAHATQAADAAERLGWEPHHAPAWRAIVADVENVSETAWLTAFGSALRLRGFLCWPYMSIGVLPSNPPGYQVWAALWNGLTTIPPVHDVIAHQYGHDLPWKGTSVDLSVVMSTELASFGHGPRR